MSKINNSSQHVAYREWNPRCPSFSIIVQIVHMKQGEGILLVKVSGDRLHIYSILQ